MDDPILIGQNEIEQHPIRDAFQRFSIATADLTGTPVAFLLSVLLVVIWLLSGPYFHYSDTWQLVINSISSVAAFLMVFVIQNSQTRDTWEIHLKLDELIRAVDSARNQFMDLEDLSEEQLQRLGDSFKRQAEQKRHPIK
jgi:low affinity Fe/Cu permease